MEELKGKAAAEANAKAGAGKKKKKNTLHTVLTVVGIALCVFFGLILIFNITIIIKGLINPNTPPTVFGYAPLIVKSGSMSSDETHRLNSSEIVGKTEEEIAALKPGDIVESMMGDCRLTNVIQTVTAPKGGERFFLVERPAADHIEVGDLIFSKQIDLKELKAGDIISYLENSSVVTHRIIRVNNENGQLSFTTKGDANDTEDPDAVPADRVVGVFKGRLAGVGDFIFFLQQPWGMALFIGVPVVAFIVFDIIRRQRSAKKVDKEQGEMEAELERLRKLAKEQEDKKAEEERAREKSEKDELLAELERLRALAGEKKED